MFPLLHLLLTLLTVHGVEVVNIGIVVDDSNGFISRMLNSSSIIKTLSERSHVSLKIFNLGEESFFRSRDLACNDLQGVSAVVSLLDCFLSLGLTAHLGWLPHLAISPTRCPPMEGISPGTFFLASPPDWPLQVISTVVLQEKWDSLTIIHDHSHGEGALRSMMTSLTISLVKVRMFRVTGHATQGSDVLPVLLRAIAAEEKHFAVLVESAAIREILRCAESLQLNVWNYNWIIANEQLSRDSVKTWDLSGFKEGNLAFAFKNHRNFQKFSCKKARDHLVDKIPPHSTAEEISVLDSILLLADAFRHFEDEPSVQSDLLMLNSCENDNVTSTSVEAARRVIAQLENNTRDVALNDVRFDEDHHNRNITYDVYCVVVSGATIQLTATARWSQESGLLMRDNEVFVSEAVRLRSAMLTVTTKPSPPFVVQEVDRNGGFRYNGIFFEVLDELSKRLGFNFWSLGKGIQVWIAHGSNCLVPFLSYSVVPPKDGVYGAPYANGSWNGMIGMLMRKEVNIVIAPMTVTSDRLAVVDFCEPIIEDGVGILMLRPDGSADKVFRMFKPFEPVVWVALIFCIFFVGAILHFINSRSAALMPEGQPRVPWQESLWAIYAHYIEQGYDMMPESNSGRCLMILWWMVVIAMSAFYTANLVAFLTVSLPSKPVNGLEDLVAPSAPLHPLIKEGSNLLTLFKDSQPGTTYRKVWDRIEQDIAAGLILPTDNDNAYETLLSGAAYAFLMDSKQLQYHMTQDCGKFVMADSTFNSAGLAFAFEKGSRLADKFSYNIIRMKETGLIERWRQRWWSSSGECGEPSGPTSTAEPLDLLSITSVFVVLGVAVILGLLSIIIERHIAHKKVKAQKVENSRVTLT